MKFIITDHHWDRSFSAMNFFTLILVRILKKIFFLHKYQLHEIITLLRYLYMVLLNCCSAWKLYYWITVLLNDCVTRYCITELLYYCITELLYYWINSLNCWSLIETLKKIWIAVFFLIINIGKKSSKS